MRSATLVLARAVGEALLVAAADVVGAAVDWEVLDWLGVMVTVADVLGVDELDEELDADGDTVPEADGVTVPDADGDTLPEADGVTVPDADGDTVPEADGVTVTEADGDTVPEADGVTVPETDGDTVPDAVTDVVREGDAEADTEAVGKADEV